MQYYTTHKMTSVCLIDIRQTSRDKTRGSSWLRSGFSSILQRGPEDWLGGLDTFCFLTPSLTISLIPVFIYYLFSTFTSICLPYPSVYHPLPLILSHFLASLCQYLCLSHVFLIFFLLIHRLIRTPFFTLSPASISVTVLLKKGEFRLDWPHDKKVMGQCSQLLTATVLIQGSTVMEVTKCRSANKNLNRRGSSDSHLLSGLSSHMTGHTQQLHYISFHFEL